MNTTEVKLYTQEGRYYYVTTFTEKIGERYFTTNPLQYMGKYIGSRSEGWGDNQKEWLHFTDDDGYENVITHTTNMAFYETQPLKVVAPIKELPVLRTPVKDKYYEATFWTRKEGHWSNEKHYTKETTPREYAGKFLRNRTEGWGDGADHWAIFLRDGKEIEIEYDYDGKRAWYEVEARN